MHRMSLHEAGEVARRAAASGARVHGGGPTVHKLADALGLPPSEVEILLDQSRQGGSAIRDFKVVLGVAALIFAFMLGFGTTSLIGRREASPVAVSTPVPSAPVGTAVVQPSYSPGVQAMRNAAPAMASAMDGEPSQLTGQLGTLEAKTSAGDVRNAAERARRSLTPVMDNGGTGGPSRMLTSTAIAR